MLASYIKPIKMMSIASLSRAVFAVPFFLLVQSGNEVLFISTELIVILLSQMFVAPAFTTMAKLFPYKLRYRGVAMGNCLGLALLGGITLYISAYSIKYIGQAWAPGIYLALVSFSGFIAIQIAHKKIAYQQLTK